MLQTFIFHNSDLNGQTACTKTAVAVDGLLDSWNVTREQLISIQTNITAFTYDTLTSIMCTATVVIDISPEEDDGYIEPTEENFEAETLAESSIVVDRREAEELPF